MGEPYFDSVSSKAFDQTPNRKPSKGVSKISFKRSYPTPRQNLNKKSVQFNQEQPEIIYEDKPTEISKTRSKSEFKCQISLCGSTYRIFRCGPELFWILLLCLALSLTIAAFVITIIVGLLSTTATVNPCAVTYSQIFIYNTNSASQCTAWTAFLANLTCTTYTKLQIYGSRDRTGITLTDSVVVTALATALRTSTAYTGTANGYTMKVGACGGGYEITASGTVCQCNTGYTVRPCIGGSSWGDINGASTCGAANQTMALSFS